MRPAFAQSMLAVVTALILTGCAGPEQKLGRGLSNLGDLIQMGEISRAYEQASLFEGPDSGRTTGLVRGFNASVKRAAIGAYEIVTFPIPNYKHADYGPILKPVGPVYPASYRPGLPAESILSTDYSIGFGSGEVAPMFPGSRFRIYEP